MGKKVFSLCMALVLCLSLLPVTALAAAPPENQVLYVGGVPISSTGYWTTDDKGSVTAYTGGDTPTDNYIHYDAGDNTLTLHNATIKKRLEYSENIEGGTYIFGSAIGVLNQNGAAELTITLEGTNTIAEVGKGIYVLASSTSTGGATLTITGGGSLDASASQTGIFVQSNSGDATLTIRDADVEAEVTGSNGDGVLVQAGQSSNASLSVNGGSLTATGSGTDGAGIRFLFGSSDSSSRTPSLTVSGNAMVKASGGEGGISTNSSTATEIKSDSEATSGGIVFNGNEGTVYGSVELQEDLTVENGQTLTIPDGASLTIDSGATLTNEGTVTTTGDGTLTNNGKIENSGTLPDDINGNGTVNHAPTITTDSLPNGTEGTSYSQTLTATGTAPITWSVTSGSLPTGLTLNESTGLISGTPTTAGTSTFTVKAANDYGSDSKSLSITIGAAALSITTQPGSQSVTEGQTASFSVAATGSGTLTYQWQQSTDSGDSWTDISGATNTIYTITTTTADMSGYQYHCVVTGNGSSVTSDAATLTVTPKQYTLMVVLNGGSGTTTSGEYAAGAVVQIDAGTRSSHRFTGWTTSNGGTFADASSTSTTFTMPAADTTITANWAYSGGGGGSSRPTPSLSDRAIDDIQDARPGDTVEITLRPGRTTLEREVFEELAGQDITLEIDAGDGVLWTVNGLDIPEDTRLHDLDLDVDLGDSDIPATVLNAVTGEIDTVQLSLAHDGRFGFTMTLSAPLGRDNADYWANLYWYNERTEELEFQQAARIAKDGTAEFALDHASDYAIVIDDRSHEPVDLPFNDVPESYWAYDAIQYVYGEGLMAGTSGSTFNPESTTTRGQIVTILWRLSGSPAVNYLMDFDDVDPAAYYAEAIRWATSEGIAGGYGGGVFGPDDPITREQLAVMLHRYAQHEGYDVSVGEDTNILSYADAFTVSEYAVSALQWACGAGIISGTGDGSTLTPQGEATRAQAATVLMRFCEEYQ